MALQKTISFPNGTSGNYVRLGSYMFDRTTREASAHFHLHASKAFADASPEQSVGLCAVLRLRGDKFDAYLSANSDTERSALYRAAKVEPLIAGSGLTEISFSDAADV